MDLVNNIEELDKNGLIHAFKWNDSGYIFDATSNSIFECSKQDVKKIQSNEFDEELNNEIKKLVQQGYFAKEKNLPFDDSRVCKSLCLMITRDCNFRCPYCFEKGSKAPSKKIMTKKMGEDALQFLVRTSGSRKYLECDFFGGEPLLGWDVVKHIIEYSKTIEEKTGKKFRFSLTSNASLLTKEMTDYLHDHTVSLILSEDGLPENHNRFRILADGSGTYETVMNAIKPVSKEWGEGYYLRGTYTKKNINFLEDLKHLYSEGIKKISFEPVVSDNTKIGFTKQDIPMIKKEYQNVTKWYLDTYKEDKEFSFYHFEVNLEFGACKEKLMTSCGAGVEYLSVSPDGDLYPCHQFDGNSEFKIGSIKDGITNLAIVEKFRSATNLNSKKECKTCWARYLCGGGCSANNNRMNGSLTASWEIGCEIQKTRIEAALYVQVKKKELLLKKDSSR
ncbi:MAG: SPASM domain-containing protein [Caldisericia bacterium]|nr:SPASM domain-containing protein [Caldisericia bacterium]